MATCRVSAPLPTPSELRFPPTYPPTRLPIHPHTQPFPCAVLVAQPGRSPPQDPTTRTPTPTPTSTPARPSLLVPPSLSIPPYPSQSLPVPISPDRTGLSPQRPRTGTGCGGAEGGSEGHRVKVIGFHRASREMGPGVRLSDQAVVTSLWWSRYDIHPHTHQPPTTVTPVPWRLRSARRRWCAAQTGSHGPEAPRASRTGQTPQRWCATPLCLETATRNHKGAVPRPSACLPPSSCQIAKPTHAHTRGPHLPCLLAPSILPSAPPATSGAASPSPTHPPILLRSTPTPTPRSSPLLHPPPSPFPLHAPPFTLPLSPSPLDGRGLPQDPLGRRPKHGVRHRLDALGEAALGAVRRAAAASPAPASPAPWRVEVFAVAAIGVV